MSAAEENAFRLLYNACTAFVRKCDAGEARSKRSYAQMKEALAAADVAIRLMED